VPPPGHVQHRGACAEGVDLPGDETLVPGAPGSAEFGFPAAAAGFGFGEEALVGGGQRGIAEPGSGLGRSAGGEVDLGRGGPLAAEQAGGSGDCRGGVAG
jgi:hypothetical protein